MIGVSAAPAPVNIVSSTAAALSANTSDVQGHVLTQVNSLTPDSSASIDTVHDAGLVFNDAMAQLIGVVSGNQDSIINDLIATAVGLQNAVTDQEITGHALDDINHIISLLGQEASLVGDVGTELSASADTVNGQINQIQAQILNIVDHDAALATMAVGADGTVGFAAPSLPGSTPSQTSAVAGASATTNSRSSDALTAPLAADAHAQGDHTVPHFHFEHLWN